MQSKNVGIVNFSIFGVAGFKSVFAEGAASVNKRMLSAKNHMERLIKKEHLEISPILDGSTSYLPSEEMSEKIARGRTLARALELLEEVNSFSYNNIQVVFKVVATEKIITTEQFFVETTEIFKDNVSTFINNLDNIETAIEKIRDEFKVDAATKVAKKKDIKPYLYICTGGSFGNDRVQVILSGEEIDVAGSEKAVHTKLTAAITMAKNFRLTDYLRAVKEERKEIIKKHIEHIDTLFDTIDDVSIDYLGPLMPDLSTRASEQQVTTAGRMLSSLLMANEIRLLEYFSTDNNATSVTA